LFAYLFGFVNVRNVNRNNCFSQYVRSDSKKPNMPSGVAISLISCANYRDVLIYKAKGIEILYSVLGPLEQPRQNKNFLYRHYKAKEPTKEGPHSLIPGCHKEMLSILADQ